MGSLAKHFPSLIFLSFLLSINGNSMQSPNPACPSFNCGNGITIGYPFSHQSQQFEHCGYPGFNLSCIDQNPVLYLSDDNNPYPIKEINYSNKSLTLAYPIIKQATCPKLLHDITVNSTPNSLFNFSFGNKMVHFFYNCTLYPPSVPHIECLQYGPKRSFAFTERAIPEFDWRSYCESTVAVPVIDGAVDGELVEDFRRALGDGFKLTWKQPEDGICRSCEDSGGLCGYSNGLPNNFACICSHGRHLINCHDNYTSPSHIKGDVSIGGEPNYAAIGAVLFGALVMIMVTVFYFIEKKKVGSYKPV